MNSFFYLLLLAIACLLWWAVAELFSSGEIVGVFVTGFFALLITACLVAVPIGNMRKAQRYALVEEDFDLVMTTLDHVEDMDQNYYYVHTKWVDPDGGAVFYFKSDYIRFDPTKFLQGKEIPVKISRQDYKKYVVDLSSLPTLAS
ncbi:hypothetical protein [Ignatzschineria sp. LJL83]